ncbi:hypothetical protein [Nonomuraea candida]|uniref:hypothetical protein n=1 Tax=Nonomuraea candida TaxID=359159 RepID=UPI0005BACFDA|nr:hypothetical protein [Nonomuraea candida]
MRLAWVLLLLLAGCAPGAGSPARTPDAPAGSWQLTHTWNGPGEHKWHSIAALSTGEAWAFAAGDTPLMLRWDGRAWRTARPPEHFRIAGYGFGFRTSPAGDDLWLVAGGVWQRVRDAWVRRPRPSRYEDLDSKDLAVTARGQVWLAETGEYGGWYLHRRDGGTWKPVRPPGGEPGSTWLERVAASGPGHLWAIQHAGGAARAIRWEGSRWSVHPLPHVPAPSPAPTGCVSGTGRPRFAVQALAVPADGDAWAVGSVLVGEPGACPHSVAADGVVLRWRDGRWSRVPRPMPGTALTAARADTEGGVWIAANPAEGRRPYLLHVKDGRWTEHPLPEGPTEIMDLAPVPGTTRVWVYARQGTQASRLYRLTP